MGNVYKSAKQINKQVVDCDINQRCLMGAASLISAVKL